MTNRRNFLCSSALGFIATSGISGIKFTTANDSKVSDRYPAIPLSMVNEVVGAAHSNLDKVKELVEARPELANATWDWGWGDIETALGAASHMGRRDIAEYLISKGARHDFFTMVMLGQVSAVKAAVEANPGIQRVAGPHGITVLSHAKIRLRRRDSMDKQDIANMESMLSYLEGLGDADNRPTRQELSDAEKEMYVGEYRFGEGERDALVVKLNMRKMLSLSRKGDFGRGMYRLTDHTFGLESAPSVKVTFKVKEGKAYELHLTEPDFSLNAQVV